MTGKDMLTAIQNLDEDMIAEAEFGTYQKKWDHQKKSVSSHIGGNLTCGRADRGRGIYPVVEYDAVGKLWWRAAL